MQICANGRLERYHCTLTRISYFYTFRACGERPDSAVTAICDTPIAVQLNFDRFEGKSQLLILQYRLHKALTISAERDY